MGFRDRAASDAARILGNDQEFGERVLYNGSQIAAVLERGEAAGRGNGFSSSGQAPRLCLWVDAKFVPEPRQGDVVREGTREWTVARILESGGFMHRLEAFRDESPWG